MSRLPLRAQARRAVLVAGLATLFCSPPAQALDGCTVLLCLAGDWRRIPACVPPVREFFRDLARLRPWPGCARIGHLESTSIRPGACPAQDRRPGAAGPCRFDGVIALSLDGRPWARVWWRGEDGATRTDFTDEARARLGAGRARADGDELAAWRPEAAPP